ncbi:MAG: hypothetical protein GC204_17030 [Chloroflexi bacterium]|nr:hypothetical protein [Chloroflexota bacterium]
MVRLGIGVILLAIVLLIGALLLPNVLTPLTPLYCHAGETLIQRTFTFSIPGESTTSFYYHCADSSGVERADVSSQVTWSILGVFMLIEFTGVALTAIGSQRKLRRTLADSDETGSTLPKRLRQSKPGMTLAERLHQLQEAHNAGLIDDDEYQKLREESLTKLN